MSKWLSLSFHARSYLFGSNIPFYWRSGSDAIKTLEVVVNSSSSPAQLQPECLSCCFVYTSHSLNSSNGGYIADDTGDDSRGY